MSTEKIDIPGLLSRMPLFSALSPEDLAVMAAATRERRLQKGDRLFQRGDQPKGFFLVVWGQIKLAFTSAQGNEKVVEILGPLQSFGEAVMFLEYLASDAAQRYFADGNNEWPAVASVKVSGNPALEAMGDFKV
ncbi:MAG: cyclic nucleotide-binding domain-containing protein, partial [Zoogloea sp.]|nr:cyclic nucleotide-binding domain-containing protein [Zoogloea sp.]